MRTSYGANSETRKEYNSLNSRYKNSKDVDFGQMATEPFKMFPYDVYQQNVFAA